MTAPRTTAEAVASEAFSLIGSPRQIVPFSRRYQNFDLAAAYEAVVLLRDKRKAHGEKPVGRKIGFTNRSIWQGYGISGPMWNYVFDSTVADCPPDASFPVANFPELRIEPEIVLHLAKAPVPDMQERELLACIDWIAHGFEMVHSIFPRWEFSAADAAAAYGVHSGLLIGPRRDVTEDRDPWERYLSSFRIELIGSNGSRREGSGTNVLGSPLTALRFLVDEIGRFPGSEPLHADEIVTTGTLTEAMPAVAGEQWETELRDIPLEGLHIRFR